MSREASGAGVWIGIAAVVGGVFWLAYPKPGSRAAAPVAAATAAATPSTVHSPAARECAETIEQKKALYVQLLDARKFWDARLALEDCPYLLNDPTLIAMKNGASRLSYLVTINNAKEAAYTRLGAIATLRTDFPADAVQFDALEARLRPLADQDAAKETKRAAAAEKARRRKEGVRLGMTQEDVLASSWGRPSRVNRTTYTFATHEQWVYDGGGYLYFKNGILETIQN